MESTKPIGAQSPNVGQQVVDEHLRDLRHFLPDERVAAWSEQRYADARAFHARQRSLDNERRQAEVSRQKKELRLKMNAQKVIFKEQIEREAKQKRETERLFRLEESQRRWNVIQEQSRAKSQETYIPGSVPPPPPLPFNTMPDIVIWHGEHAGQNDVYYDFAQPSDFRVKFKARAK